LIVYIVSLLPVNLIYYADLHGFYLCTSFKTYFTVGASMKRVVITAKGRVQRVGYRDEVEEIARKLNVTGFVENVKPYDVRIVAEGDDEHIDMFIKRLKIIKFPIDVENVEVDFDVFAGEFDYFEIKRGEWGEEIAERLDTAGKLLYRSVELGERTFKVAERSAKFGEESVEIGKKMLEKQDMMLEKQDATIDAIDRSKEEIVTEISALREDLRTYMEEKFTRIEQELEAIKVKIGMV
jgi:acylphosphatase